MTPRSRKLLSESTLKRAFAALIARVLPKEHSKTFEGHEGDFVASSFVWYTLRVMKIAIIGTDLEKVKETRSKAMSEWGVYKTPMEDIFSITYPEDETKLEEGFLEWTKDMNPTERKFMFRLDLLLSQMEKYKEQSYMFYVGCGIDLICEAVIANQKGEVSDDVVEKLIYYNKKLMRKLDAIFWIPNELTEEHEGTELESLEAVYGNLWQEYQDNIAASPFFDPDDCPGYLRVDDENPITYMRYVINPRGNLADGKDDIVDMAQMERLFRMAPGLLDAIKGGKLPEPPAQQ